MSKVQYQSYIQLNQSSWLGYWKLAEVLSDRTFYDEAAKAYKTAIDLNPNLDEAHHGLGEALFRLGNWDEAIASYQKALALNPNLTESQSSLKVALEKKADLANRFCAKPFEHFEVNQVGDVYCCCPDWLPTPIGNLETDDLENVWNSDTAKDIRQSVLDGNYKYCLAKRCPLISDELLPEKKYISEPDLREIIDRGLTVLDTKPKVLNLCYDRSCNLSCPSCRTSIITIKGEEYIQKEKLQDKLLESALDDAELLIVTGSGDPFGSHLYNQLLTNLDATQYPKLSIRLITNGQLFTPSAWDKWHKSNRSIKIVTISVDAASEQTYPLVRRGGEFPKLLANLEFVSQLRQQGDLDFVEICFVVQQLNYQEMPEFVKLGIRFTLI